MQNIQVCRNSGCESTEFEKNENDQLICVHCGVVNGVQLTGNDDIQFDDNKRAIGQVHKFKKQENYDYVRPRQIIGEFTSILQIEPEICQQIGETPLRIVKFAQLGGFLDKGSNVNYYIASALLISLQFHRAPYLMMDFSQKLKINLYKLARCYQKLTNYLNITLKLSEKLPTIDPSVYIPRFCSLCNFDNVETTQKIADSALKLLQRMTLDWITYGRRPSSLFGCAILIASRMHGFKQTPADISQMVLISEQTIRKRLNQFKETGIAQLSIDRFHQIDDVQKISQQADPPSFRNKIIKDKPKIKAIEPQIKKQEIEKPSNFEKDKIEPSKIQNQESDSEIVYQSDSDHDESLDKEQVNEEIENDINLEEEIQQNCKNFEKEEIQQSGDVDDSSFEIKDIPNLTLLRRKSSKQEFEEVLDMELALIKQPSILKKVQNINVNQILSDQSGDEIDQLILNQLEAAKQNIDWHQKNQDWVNQQKRKSEIIHSSQPLNDQPRKKRKSSDILEPGSDPVIALISQNGTQNFDPDELKSILEDVKRTKFDEIFNEQNKNRIDNFIIQTSEFKEIEGRFQKHEESDGYEHDDDD